MPAWSLFVFGSDCDCLLDFIAMPFPLNPLRHVPSIAHVKINQGTSTVGSFIDPEWVLHYIAAGDWEFVIESKAYRVSTGNMVLLPPHVLHIVRPISGKRLVQWVIHFELSEGPVPLGAFPYAVRLPNPARRQVAALFTMLRTQWASRRQSGAVPLAEGLVVAMAGIYVSNIKQPSPASGEVGNWRNVERAIQFIQKDYAHPDLTLADVSKIARISPNHFCRVFKRHVGMSTMHYLARYRIQKAEELLLNSSMNCSEIAQKVGLENIHYFSQPLPQDPGNAAYGVPGFAQSLIWGRDSPGCTVARRSTATAEGSSVARACDGYRGSGAKDGMGRAREGFRGPKHRRTFF